MAPDVIRLSPEVEEILHELARRPGSSLLRVRREDVERTVLEDQALARVTTPGLDEAERHLVQAHREELAYVLRQAAYFTLTRGAHAAYFLDSAHPDNATARLQAYSSRSGAEPLALAPWDAGYRDAEDLLRRCVSSCHGVPSTPLELAATSHRLVPTDQARIYVGMSRICEGQLAASIHVLGRVVAGRGSTEHCHAALSNICMAHALGGDCISALGAARLAFSLKPDDLATILNCFWSSAELGLAQSALESAIQLDGAFEKSPEHAARVADIYGSRARGWKGRASGMRTKTLTQVLPQVHPLTREVLLALH